ncbi:MAG: patatin-like phospholipase family protein [Proteobacteria bacterium]|nr:patatin-like phospholipase family protein [Pseudomonadota bacterium]
MDGVRQKKIGLVLSGGGSRSAYQVGAIRALSEYFTAKDLKISVIVGCSIGAMNSIVLGGCLNRGFINAVTTLETIWKERNYRNTFGGSPTKAFLNAIQVAIFRYSSPGPIATSLSIFDPSPLQKRVDQILDENLSPTGYLGEQLDSVAVMATIEGKERKPLLFVCSKKTKEEINLTKANFVITHLDRLTAVHGLASAALPSVLPPIYLNVDSGQVRLVDGGISDNIPVDPALRLGAETIITVDTSGRRWWHDRYHRPYYTREQWEIMADEKTVCLYPEKSVDIINKSGFGEVLKKAAGNSTKDFITALGVTWPIFRILKHKMGEELAYEVMSYVALHPGYTEALIELGYKETKEKIDKGLDL